MTDDLPTPANPCEEPSVHYTDRKLHFQPAPNCLHGKSLHGILPRKEWDRIRRAVYRWYNYTCAICGATNTTMICHEVWHYDDTTRTRTLTDFQAICRMCNFCIHINLTLSLLEDGKITREKYNEVVKHYVRINQCCEEWDYALDLETAHWRGVNMSRYDDWKQEVGNYEELIQAKE